MLASSAEPTGRAGRGAVQSADHGISAKADEHTVSGNDRHGPFALDVVALALLLAFVPNAARAFTVTSELEAFAIPSVGAGFQSVTFENSYTNPVAVCNYVLPSASDPPATVRITGLSGTGMQVRLQQFPNSSAVTAGTVQCIVAETGQYTLPDGRTFEARSALSTATHGQNAVDGWNMGALTNVSGLVTGSYTNPAVLAGVMSFNDTDASVAYVNDCDARGNPPFDTGMADGICVSKHIGQMSGSRSAETIGFIVVEGGSGGFDDVAYSAGTTGRTIAGVGNTPPYTTPLGADFEAGIGTQLAEVGGQGGWFVLYGSNPLSGNLSGAIEEEIVAGDTTRRHTTEAISYWVFRRTPEFTIAKTVDQAQTADVAPLNYEIVLENTGRIDLTGVTIADTLPDGSAAALSGPIESNTAGTPGVLEPAETWTYTTSYTPTPADITAGSDLINTVTSGNAQYTANGFADETASATTTISTPAPALDITKQATIAGVPANGTNDNVPRGGVITYTYTITNSGNQTISDISLTDIHNGIGGTAPVPDPETATLIDNAPTGGSANTNASNGVWDQLGPNDQISVTATYTVTQQDVDQLQ